MSGLTQLGRLRILRDSPSQGLPWRDGDGWLLELEATGWVERSQDKRFYSLSSGGVELLLRHDQ